MDYSNPETITKEFNLILVKGISVAQTSPQSYEITVSPNNQSLTFSFYIPTNFPSVPPIFAIESSSCNVSQQKKEEINLKIKECCTFTKKQNGFFLMVINEIISLLSPQNDVIEEIRIPDSIETSRLKNEATLNQNISDEWIRNRTNSFQFPKKNDVDKITRDSLMIYCFFRACSGNYSLDECANILIYQYKVIKSPGPPISSIPVIVSNFFENYKEAPSYLQELFQNNENRTSQTLPFFNDFTVISLCAPSVVKARNRVDRRIYAIKVIHLKHQTTIPPEITQLTQLQHRYIVRYYNSWISDANSEESKAISETFCLSPTIKEPASFLFIQMDYLSGTPLSKMLHDPHFFELRGLQWKIARQVVEALQYLHSHNVVHNSMTTTNIIIDGDNAKIGDFSDKTKSPPFPYCDPRGVSDSKSDMFGFAVVFFEMWYPFSNENERINILTKLVNNAEIPDNWRKVFPLQAQIVMLLLQNEQNRPHAMDLLPLIQSNDFERDSTDSNQLTKAISHGNIKLESHAPEILASLFHESRKLPFQLSKFINPRIKAANTFSKLEKTHLHEKRGSGNHIGMLEGKDSSENNIALFNVTKAFESHIIETFFKIAKLFDAKYCVSNIIQPVSDDSPTILMTNDGVLHGTQSSTSCLKFPSQISSRTFTRFFSLKESIDQINENDVLSFDTVLQNPDTFSNHLCYYFDHIYFMMTYLNEVFPDSSKQVEIVTIAIAQWLNQINQKKKILTFESFLKIFKSHKEKNPQIEDEIANLKLLVSYFETRMSGKDSNTSKELTFYVGASLPRNFLQKKQMKRFSIDFFVDKCFIGRTFRSQRIVPNSKSQSILSTRLLVLKCLSQFTYGTNFKGKSVKEVFIIIVCSPFQQSDSMESIPRCVYPTKEWRNSYLQMQAISSLFRKNGISTSFAPNDGESISYHLNEASALFIPLIILSYVDERNKIILRFSEDNKEVKKYLIESPLKKRVTIQEYNPV